MLIYDAYVMVPGNSSFKVYHEVCIVNFYLHTEFLSYNNAYTHREEAVSVHLCICVCMCVHKYMYI